MQSITRKPHIIILFLVLCTAFLGACKEQHLYSEGFRVGSVKKLSFKGDSDKKKTYEGELAVMAGTNLTGETWLFSVDPDDKDVVAELEKAAENGGRYRLDYHQYKNADSDRTYMTEYRVKKVTLLK